MNTSQVTLEFDAKYESLVRRALALAEEMEQLALTAPDGTVFDACEQAVIDKGRKFQAQALNEAVARRIEAAEKKGAPIRRCVCGCCKENRGPQVRHLLSAVGDIAFTRRYWKCRCGAAGAYAADALLGIEGQRFSKIVQKHTCRLGADNSFAATSAHLHELLGIDLCPETVRTVVEGHGRALARFQTRDQQSARAFAQAAGEVEFAVDAGKVNTREEGWKDLKIAVVSKREAGTPTSPETPAASHEDRLPRATISLAFATIATAHDFRRLWRPWLRRLGVRCFADMHALGDGAGWIWKAVQRCLTGCTQTLDFFHACQYLNECAEEIFDGDTPKKDEAFQEGRILLAQQGWQGVCRWIGQLLSIDDDQERERRRRAAEKVIKYFVAHLKRLNYAECLQNGRAIGSGIVEGRAKTLGLRLKLRGARWNRSNVTPMASLVCVRQTCEWDAYWTMAA